MTLKTAKDYETLGYEHGAGRQKRRTLQPGSWQHAAYWRGINNYAADQQAKANALVAAPKPPNSPITAAAYEMQANLDAAQTLIAALGRRVKAAKGQWPGAACEHLRMLALELQTCSDVQRQNRLIRSADRLILRHGRKREGGRVLGACQMKPLHAPDFAMSTQPHPDGPITARQLLAGE